MNLIEFIDKIKTPQNPSLFDQHYIFHFRLQGGQYPLLFFSFLMKKLKQIIPFDIETIHLDTEKESIAKSKIATTFLGQKKLYWLENISDLKSKDRSKWVKTLQPYCGPNIVAFFSDTDVKLGAKKAIVVDLDPFVDQKTFLKLSEFCSELLTKSFAKIFSTSTGLRAGPLSKNKKLTLDMFCMLMRYTFLVGKNHKEFIDTWLNKIIEPEKSLFTLSQYFFDRNAQKFFALWLNIKDDYQEQFWITFWSEQTWRACNVVQLIQAKKVADARRVSFRLPFSFMQRSWRNFNTVELKNAHDFLYKIDYSLKNGGDPFSLDLFYAKFLNRQFRP
ncbi:hypothetical protein ACFLYA_01055 [Candidatus Dependentiae bacterium]